MNSASPPVTVGQRRVKRQLLLLVDVVEPFLRNVSIRQEPSQVPGILSTLVPTPFEAHFPQE